MLLLTVRSAGLAALISGVSFIVAEGILLFVADTDHWDCNSGSDVWVNALYLIGFLLLAPAVLGMHRHQSSRVSRWGTGAAFVAAAGAVTTGVVNAAEHCLHLPIGIFFAVAGLTTVVALVVFAVSVVRSGVFPKWLGLILLLGALILQLAGDQGGVYGFGAAWIAVGSGLLVLSRRTMRSTSGGPIVTR